MKRKNSRAGFTLVELIVVIAILGILAGVGTVAYSGYMKRTNEGLDEKLYHEIVYAGAVGSYANPGVQGRVLVTTSGASVSSSSGDEAEAIVKKWMSDAFGSDWQTAVKYRTETYANTSKYNTIVLPQAGVTLSEAQAALRDTFNQSNFSGNETAVAEQVDAVVDAFSGFLESGMVDLDTIEDFMSPEEFKEWKDKYSLNDESSNTEIANATVLHVASKAAELNPELLYEIFANPNTTSDAANAELDKIGDDIFTLTALQYGIGTGYYNSEYASDTFKETYEGTELTSANSVVNLLGDAMFDQGDEEGWDEDSGMAYSVRFAEYMKSETNGGKADIEGYLAALQVLNEHSDQIDISDPNAFSNDSTLGLLQAILSAN